MTRSKDYKCGIYCIENIANGKKYIGFSTDLHRRIITHKKFLKDNKHTNDYLQRSYNKYGEENFTYTIVQYLPEDEDLLNNMEVYWIVYFNSFIDCDGYNLTMGGEGICLKRHSEETKQKLSRAFKGRISPAKGKIMSQDQKNKISASNKGKPKSKEHIEHIVEALAKNKILKEKKEKRQKKIKKIIKKKEIASSGYVGVYKNGNYWRARFEYLRKTYNSFGHKTKEDAALAYNEMAIRIKGENCFLNTIKYEEEN